MYKTETFIDIEKKLAATKGDRWKGEKRYIRNLGVTCIHYYIQNS